MEPIFSSCVKFMHSIYHNRDKSHDLSHALAVWKNSLDILYSTAHPYENLEFMVSIVALFHDAFDRKYDYDGKLRERTREFLNSITSDSDIIVNIIDRISFSREKKFGRNDWLATLGEKGLLIRNIVSDADKLEGLGKKGYFRCSEYNRALYPNWTKDQVQNEVHQYLRENNMEFKDHYICTSHGKLLSEPLHNELDAILSRI